MLSAHIKQVDTKLNTLSLEEMTQFISALKVIRVDKTSGQGKPRAEHAHMYVPTLVQTRPGGEGKASIIMALPDSGNLLANAAIDSEFHARLWISIEDTKIRAGWPINSHWKFRECPKESI